MKTMKFMLVCAALLAASLAQAQQLVLVPDPTPKITVDGSGVIFTAPDEAAVSLGVYILEKDLQKAKIASDEAMSRLLHVASELGLNPEEVSSSALNIEPQYSNESTPQFLGYEVSRSMDVTLNDLSKLDTLVDRAIKAGANRDFSITLRSSKEKELKEQALVLAAQDARRQAERIAGALGAKVGDVKNVGSASRGTSAAMASTLSFGRGTFQAAKIRIEASLSVSFLLE